MAEINDYLIQLQNTIISGFMATHSYEEKSIYELISIKYGSPFKSSMFSDTEGIDLIRIRDLKTDSPQVKTVEKIPDMEYVNPGDVIVGMDAEFRPHIWVGNQGLLNQRVCKLIPNDNYSTALAYHFLMDPLFAVESYKTGTTVSHIGKSDFDAMTVMLPTDSDLSVLSKMIEPINTSYVNNGKAIRVLSNLRNTLLAELFESNK